MQWQGTESQLSELAQNALDTLTNQSTDTASVLCLSGELGAGKTTFVKALAHQLGIDEPVRSPTFVIEKIYALEEQMFNYLVHIDAYRLESGQELQTLGFDELLKDPKSLIVIEWPENVRDMLPDNSIRLEFEVVDETTRKVTLGNDKIQNPNDKF